MPHVKQKRIAKNSKLPTGNADVLVCENGCLYIVGWAVFDDTNFQPAEVLLHPEGLPAIKISVAPQIRTDVNEHLGISPQLASGFSILLSLSQFTTEELPSGIVKVYFADPNNENDEILAGTLNIVRSESNLSVTPEMILERKEETKYKPPGFLQKLWRGEFGSDPALKPIMSSTASLTAKSILDATQLMKDRPHLALTLQNSKSMLMAQNLHSASQNRGLIILFDHNFGGGANTHSNALVTQHLTGQNVVLRIWYQLDQSTFRAAFISSKDLIEFDIGSLNFVFRLCTQFPSFAIQVNSLWGYPHIDDVLDNLVRLKLYDYTERLEYFAHDHIGICPSLYLLDAKHNYCGVPSSKDICTGCLKNSTQEFKVFFQDTDIDNWRSNWQSFFMNCEMIRFFSDSTLRHYSRAYPWLKDHPNAVVKGHHVEDIWPEKVKTLNPDRSDFNIGVFGFINFHKGSAVIKDIAARIAETGDSAKICIFGALDGRSEGSYGPIHLKGSYAPKDMVQLCNDNDIDLVIIPSICPETFSITTKELTLIGIPIVTFDLGAQEELANNYAKGHVIKRKSSVPVYDRLKTIKEAL